MKPEIKAWSCLCDHAESQLSVGFAGRVVCAARCSRPSAAGQVFLSATTAVLCVVTVIIVFSQTTHAETSRNMAGWQQIAAASDDPTQAQ